MERATGGHGQQKSSYWTRRSSLMYYQYVDFLVRALATDARSLIDVGSADAEYVENFHWIPNRSTLDIFEPYSSENITGLEMDFFDFEPEEKYDFATCLQVLEHIPDAKSFARKLFQTSNRVLISVPYLWEEKPNSNHVHDPVDLDKLLDWTGREPDYHIVVREPLSNAHNSRRLISYYHLEDEKLDIKKARQNVPGIPSSPKNRVEDAGARPGGQTRSETPGVEERRLREMLENERKKNKRLEAASERKDTKIRETRKELGKTARERDRFNHLYLEIEQSRIWRYTLPVRRILSVLKRAYKRGRE